MLLYFMIPFAFKMAGGIIGGVYDFANKRREGAVESRRKKMHENPESFYNKMKRRGNTFRSDRNVTGEQLKKGAGAALNRSAFRRNRREGGTRYALQQAGRGFAAEGTRVHGKHVVAEALEAAEKDSDLKATEGSDDYGKAVRALIANGYDAASAALIASNPDQYDYNATHWTDEHGTQHVLTPEMQQTRKNAHDNMLNLGQLSISRYGEAVAELHATMQDHASGTGSDAGVMLDDVRRLSHGDRNMQVALTNAYSERAEKANRKDKSKAGFSTKLQILQHLEDGSIDQEQARQQLVKASTDRMSAGEFATMHVNGLNQARAAVLDSVREQMYDPETGRQLTQEELDNSFEYGRAQKKMADIYDVLQHTSTDQLERIEGRHISQARRDANGNIVLDATGNPVFHDPAGFMERTDLTANGTTMQASVERFRTGREVLSRDELLAGQVITQQQANAMTDAEIEAINRRQGRTFQPGARGVLGFRTGRRDYGQSEAEARGHGPEPPNPTALPGA